MLTYTRWEVSFRALSTNGKLFYKVVRRIPALSLSETKIFTSREDALVQFSEWL